jgi:hypothetical protein
MEKLTSWQTGSREKQQQEGQEIASKKTLPETYFLQAGPIFFKILIYQWIKPLIRSEPS